MSFGATTLISLSRFDEPQTPPASPSKSRDLTTRDQPGVGFFAPWRLAFSDVLHVGFTA